MREEVVVSRTCEAVMIPSGEKVLVPQGAHATITQSLGGAYTLITDRGLMVRVSGKEVEAIGKTPTEVAQAPDAAITPDKLEELVWEQLKTCFDPEIPVNIVDLGLVYLCELNQVEDGRTDVKVKMTLTAPGCGGDIAEEMERLTPLSGVHEFPSRVKCATLAWHTLNEAVHGGESASTE